MQHYHAEPILDRILCMAGRDFALHVLAALRQTPVGDTAVLVGSSGRLLIILEKLDV
jgi:hypothetical protein